MRAISILLAGGIALITAAQAQSAVVNFSHDMSTKTGWTATQGGDSGYVAGPDFVNGESSHSSVTTATSERQAFMTTPMNYGPGFSLEFDFRVMLHNTIAGVNEAVARVGLLDSGAAPAAGQILNAWITLRRVGSIELAVQRRTDDQGNWESIVSTSSPVDTAVGAGQGLSGYNYADWTVTRDATGMWTVSALNAYGDTVVNFTANESTTATLGSLDKVWVQDVSGQWNGSETAAYWSNVAVSSDGTAIPEPASLALLAVCAVPALRRCR